jgi:hypothetical protein
VLASCEALLPRSPPPGTNPVGERIGDLAPVENGTVFGSSLNRAAWDDAAGIVRRHDRQNTPLRCFRGTQLIASPRSPA